MHAGRERGSRSESWSAGSGVTEARAREADRSVEESPRPIERDGAPPASRRRQRCGSPDGACPGERRLLSRLAPLIGQPVLGQEFDGCRMHRSILDRGAGWLDPILDRPHPPAIGRAADALATGISRVSVGTLLDPPDRARRPRQRPAAEGIKAAAARTARAARPANRSRTGGTMPRTRRRLSRIRPKPTASPTPTGSARRIEPHVSAKAGTMNVTVLAAVGVVRRRTRSESSYDLDN